jgi:hypothetical protein
MTCGKLVQMAEEENEPNLNIEEFLEYMGVEIKYLR